MRKLSLRSAGVAGLWIFTAPFGAFCGFLTGAAFVPGSGETFDSELVLGWLIIGAVWILLVGEFRTRHSNPTLSDRLLGAAAVMSLVPIGLLAIFGLLAAICSIGTCETL